MKLATLRTFRDMDRDPEQDHCQDDMKGLSSRGACPESLPQNAPVQGSCLGGLHGIRHLETALRLRTKTRCSLGRAEKEHLRGFAALTRRRERPSRALSSSHTP